MSSSSGTSSLWLTTSERVGALSLPAPIVQTVTKTKSQKGADEESSPLVVGKSVYFQDAGEAKGSAATSAKPRVAPSTEERPEPARATSPVRRMAFDTRDPSPPVSRKASKVAFNVPADVHDSSTAFRGRQTGSSTPGASPRQVHRGPEHTPRRQAAFSEKASARSGLTMDAVKTTTTTTFEAALLQALETASRPLGQTYTAQTTSTWGFLDEGEGATPHLRALSGHSSPQMRSLSTPRNRSKASSPQASPMRHARSTGDVLLGTAAVQLSESSSGTSGSEVEHESTDSRFSALPQKVVVDGEVRELWSEHWGLTVGQVRALIDACREDPRWHSSCTMRDLVNLYVKPTTEGKGVGYALLVNQAKPLQVNVMVSHSWNENAEEFCDTLERTVQQDDVLFICAFSLFQSSDGSGPSICEQLGCSAEDSPFYRALRHIRDQNEKLGWTGRHFHRWCGVLPSALLSVALFLYAMPIFFNSCLPSFRYCYDPVMQDEAGAAMGRVFSSVKLPLAMGFRPFVFSAAFTGLAIVLVFAFSLGRRARPGYLVAVPNHEDDLYRRLWCVYEIFVATTLGVPVSLANTLAIAGTCSALEAQCSCEGDIDNIREEIKEWGRRNFGDDGSSGFVLVDRKIREVTFSGHWATFFMMVRVMTPLAILCMIATQLYMKSEALCGPMVAANIIGTSMGWALLVVVVFYTIQNCRGRVPPLRALGLMGTLLTVSFTYVLWKKTVSLDPDTSFGVMFLKKLGYAPFIGSQLIGTYLLAALLAHYLRLNLPAKRFLTGALLAAPVLYNVAKEVRGAGFPGSFRDDGFPWVMYILSRLGFYLGILIFGLWAFTRWGVSIYLDNGVFGGCRLSWQQTVRKARRLSGSLCIDEYAIQAPSAHFSGRGGEV